MWHPDWNEFQEIIRDPNTSVADKGDETFLRTGWGPSPLSKQMLRQFNAIPTHREKFRQVMILNEFAERNCQEHIREQRQQKGHAVAKRKAIERAKGQPSKEKTPSERVQAKKIQARRERFQMKDCYQVQIDPRTDDIIQGKPDWIQRIMNDDHDFEIQRFENYNDYNTRNGRPLRSPPPRVVVRQFEPPPIDEDDYFWENDYEMPPVRVPVEPIMELDQSINDFQGLLEDFLPPPPPLQKKSNKRKHPGFDKIYERQNKRPRREGGFAKDHWRGTF